MQFWGKCGLWVFGFATSCSVLCDELEILKLCCCCLLPRTDQASWTRESFQMATQGPYSTNRAGCRALSPFLHNGIWSLLIQIAIACFPFFPFLFLRFVFLVRKIVPELTSVTIFLYFVCGTPPQHSLMNRVKVHAPDPGPWTQDHQSRVCELNHSATGLAPKNIFEFLMTWRSAQDITLKSKRLEYKIIQKFSPNFILYVWRFFKTGNK